MVEAQVRIAIPERLIRAVGSSVRGADVDLTALIEEWAVGFLFPTDELVAAAPTLVAREQAWRLRGRATVTTPLTRLLRDVAKCPEVLRAIEATELAWLVEQDRLRVQGVSLLLGLAVVLALDAEIGQESRRLNALAARRAAEQSERQRSDAIAGLSAAVVQADGTRQSSRA